MTTMETITQLRNKVFALLFFLSFLVPGEIYSQCSQLVWHDEFDGPNLDLTKWSYQTGTGTNDNLPAGWGNGELQYYTSRKQNVNVTGGNLEIISLYEPNYLGTGVNYTSGRIRSTNPITNNPRNEWQYGSFEARIKVPEPFNDSRAWPGFWMLPHNGPWPNTGEIDIMETGNLNNPWYYNGTLHYGTAFPGFHSGTGGVTINTSSSCPTGNVGDLSVCYHIYRVDWAPNSIKFFVDNVQVGATQSNATVGSGGPIGGLWPFDQANPFHIILNMAVGGTFPGSAVNNARFPLKMLVDYVRVYSTPAAVNITGKTKILQGQTGVTYSVSNVTGNTYNWSVPSGATIASGQGTNEIKVNYGASAVSGNISVTITPSGGGCAASTNSLPVSVLVNACTITLENFETANPPTRNLGFNFATGWLNRTSPTSPSFPFGTIANPSASGVNTSANAGKYERNGGVAYDVLAYNDIVIGNGDDFKNGIVKFNMDVYSTAPAGTEILLQLENAVNAQTGWPNGIHSRYRAVTGSPNTWSTLQFAFLDAPDGGMQASSIDQLVILFNPNTYTNHTYYFDNFKRVGVTPATSTITGLTAVCQNNAGVKYSVTGLTGSTYNWTVPAGSTIASGQGTNSITVNFGTTSGTVSVTETSAAKCVGAARNLTVNVSGACILNADFSASKLNTCAGAVIVFTDLTTGKTGTETYSWNFGAGASLPAGTTGAGPFNVTYSSGGTKTVVLTVSRPGSTDTETKTNYLTIAAPPTTCLFSDEFNNTTVNWIAPIPGAFSHTEAGTAWTISNGGYGEWENFTYNLNNGSAAAPINFGCASNAPILKIRAKASANALLRIQLLDGNGLGTDNVPGFNLELTTTYQTFTINYANALRNFYSGTPGFLDSTNITKLQFFINPGYVSFPYAGTNKTYNTSFAGTVDIDWIGIGNNCFFPGTAPTITSFTPTCGAVGSTVTITGTNLSGATNVSFNGVNAAVTSNSATQIVATVPAGVSNGKISITNTGGTVLSTGNFNLRPATSAISGNNIPCVGSTGSYSVTPTVGSTYAWTVPTGATIGTGAGTNAITVNFGTATSGTISVTETNAAGCVGTPQSMAITLALSAGTVGAISGPANPCQGTTNTYSINPVIGASSYTWTLPTGWTGTSSTTSIAVTTGAGSGAIQVTANNTCGNSSATLNVAANTIPATPGTIGGNNSPCQGTATTYNVTAVAGASSYVWTLPSGWSGTSTNASISATPGASGGAITVKASNICGISNASTLTATVNTVPAAPGTISGSTSPCQGASTSYSITNVAGATSYTWTTPTGWTGSSTTAALTVTPGVTSGNIRVTANNACGASTTASTIIVSPITIPAVPGTISGSATPCQAGSATYSIAAVPGASAYIWSLPSGWTGSSSTTSLTVSTGTSTGNIAVQATNTCGTSAATTLLVTPTSKPAAPTAISGSAAPCQGTTSTYSVTSVAGATSYNWTLPTGWTGNSTAASISVTAGASSGVISVTASNSCGTSTAVTYNVVPGASPASPGTITGSATPCEGTATTYSITPLAGASSYTWSLPSGWTGTSATSSIEVTPGATAGSISVTASYTCGTSSASSKTVTPSPLPTSPGTIAGSSAPCKGVVTTYSISSVTNANSYTWTIPSGWSGTSTSTSLTVTPSAAAGNVTVAAVNACGTSTAATLPVSPKTLPGTSAITGADAVCENSIGNVYYVTNTVGSTYNWSVPAGATITGSNTNGISVNFGTVGGNITVTETNESGCVGTQIVKSVAVNAKPVTSVISGNNTPSCSGSGIVYSVTPTTGSTYTWTVPAEAVITAGHTTNSITVTFGATNGDITVTETNASGCIGTARTLPISLSGCGLAANFSGAPLSICAGETVTFTNMSTGTTAGTTYAWNFGDGANPATAATAGPHTITYTTAGTKTISLQITDGSTKSITKTDYITVHQLPTTANAGADQNITSTTATLAANTPTVGIGSWQIVAGTGTVVDLNDPQSQITDLLVGSVTLMWTISNSICASSDEVVINRSTASIGVISGPEEVEINTTYTYSVSGPGAFTWTVPTGATIVSGQGTNTISVVFSVATEGTITVSNGVMSESKEVTITGTTGIKNSNVLSYSIMPNPFQGEAMLRINYASNAKMTIRIINMHGVTVYESEEHSFNENIHLGQDLQSGIYTIMVYYEDTVTPIKVVKAK